MKIFFSYPVTGEPLKVNRTTVRHVYVSLEAMLGEMGRAVSWLEDVHSLEQEKNMVASEVATADALIVYVFDNGNRNVDDGVTFSFTAGGKYSRCKSASDENALRQAFLQALEAGRPEKVQGVEAGGITVSNLHKLRVPFIRLHIWTNEAHSWIHSEAIEVFFVAEPVPGGYDTDWAKLRAALQPYSQEECIDG